MSKVKELLKKINEAKLDRNQVNKLMKYYPEYYEWLENEGILEDFLIDIEKFDPEVVAPGYEDSDKFDIEFVLEVIKKIKKS